MKFLILTFLLSQASFADLGQITKNSGSTNGFILRGSKKLPLLKGASLENNDRISTLQSTVMLYLEPSTQILVPENAEIIIVKKDNLSSMVTLLKGHIRLKVIPLAKVEVGQSLEIGSVVASSQNADFQGALKGEDSEFDVRTGLIQLSSPLVQSFVPENLKAKEGVLFAKGQKKFVRRKVVLTEEKNSTFLSDLEVKEKWRLRKLMVRPKKNELPEI
jgi:hypothetical protein